ncbi:hypothetical protein R1sor_016814 [Riccia sorocarpa]|uniref:Uncharacterized protein n=1 Tax=Riccia sorocarpa TaxID=122646 RepID=A0ABD3HJN3_9MARC
MKPRAMARSLGAQKNAARHRMTKQDYEMIVIYLENQDNFAAINGGSRKIKIAGKTSMKMTAFGHMAVTLCARTELGANGEEFFQTSMPHVTSGDEFYHTARADEDGGPEMENQIGRSAVDVEANTARTPQQNRNPEQSRGDPSVQSVDDVRSKGKTVRSGDRALPPERKTALITAYEEQVKEKLILRKEAQDQKASFRDAILEDRLQAREQRERAKIQEGIEAMRRARADRRSTLMTEMVKTGKSMDEIQAAFLL